MNRDELTGKAKTIKGKIEQAAGDLSSNRALRNKGVADEAAGRTQAAVGRVKREVGGIIKGARQAINK